MKKRFSRILWMILLSAPFLKAQTADGIVEAVRLGQEAIYRLDFDGAAQIYRRLIRERPENPVGYGMYTNVTLNRLLFAAKNLATDDYATPNPFSRQPTYKSIQAARQNFLESVEELFVVCDRRLAADPNDAQALYFKGLGLENLATEALAVRKSSGTGDAQKFGKRARNLHERVLELDPDLIDANVSVAVAEFAAATLPWSVKWFAFLIGYRGDKEKAIERLHLVAEKGIYRRLDSQVILALLEAWKGDPGQAAQIFADLRRRFPENYLSDINLAAIYHLRLDDPTAALGVYRDLLGRLDQKAPGIQPGEIQFRMGKLYLEMGDESLALEAFQSAVDSPVSELETKPLCHYQIARIFERRGERDQALDSYRAVLEYTGPERVLEEELRRARRKLGR